MPSSRVRFALGGLVVLLGVAAGATASSATPTDFTVTVNPATATVADRGSTTVPVQVHRGDVDHGVFLSTSSLPSGVSAVFTPARRITGSTAGVVFTAQHYALPGSYRIAVFATGRAGSGSRAVVRSASTALTLTVVREVYADFSIAGTSDRALAPGVTAVLDLRVTNPHGSRLRVLRLDVTLAGTSAPACDTGNFTVTTYGGPILAVPAHSTRSLRQLGVPDVQLPTITMRNLPTNQDSCRGVRVRFTFSGAGIGF